MRSAGDETEAFDGAADPDAPDPLWVQVKQTILTRVDAGGLAPGSRLPAERELCEELGVSRVTLRKGLSALVEDGVLSASHGRGWYVATPATRGGRAEWPSRLESFTETARRMGLNPSSAVLRCDVGAAGLDDAETLSIAPGTKLLFLDRVRKLDGVPIALDQAKVPLTHAPGLAEVDFSHASLFAELQRAGAHPQRSETTIEAQEADETLATVLEIERGKPVLVLQQVVHDRDGRPLMISSVRYSGDRYRLRTSFVRGDGYLL